MVLLFWLSCEGIRGVTVWRLRKTVFNCPEIPRGLQGFFRDQRSLQRFHQFTRLFNGRDADDRCYEAKLYGIHDSEHGAAC